MSEEIRRLQNHYNLENYPYADSHENQAKLKQLGLMFGQTNAKPVNPPAEVISLPPAPVVKMGFLAKNKKLLLLIAVVVILLLLTKQK